MNSMKITKKKCDDTIYLIVKNNIYSQFEYNRNKYSNSNYIYRKRSESLNNKYYYYMIEFNTSPYYYSYFLLTH